MRGRFRGWIATILVALTTQSFSHAQREEVFLPEAGLRVEASMRWPQSCSKGYVPVRIVVENENDAAESLEVELSHYQSSATTRSVKVPPGTTEFGMLFPAFEREPSYFFHGMHSSSISLRVSRGLREKRAWGLGRTLGSSAVPIHCFLVLTERPADVGKAFDWVETIGVEHVPTHGDPYYDVDGETLAFGRAPTRFEPYTSLDVLVIDTQHGLPPSEVTEAALRYTRLGGTTLFVGRGARGLVESLESIGSFDERFLGRAEPVPDATVVAYGLGVLATYDTDSALFQDEPSLALLDWALRQHPTPAPSRPIAARGHVEGEVAGPPPDDLEGGPKIPGLVRIPYRTLTLGLVLFTILIGPVNFLLVRRAGRPVLLTVTIPLIAAVSSLCILVFGFLSAGIDSRTSEYGYTVLDQRTHRASTVVLRSLWCGLAPAGLRPGEGSALLPTQGNELSYETVGFQVDETDGLVLGGDFVPVRRAEKQTVLADRTFRGRVTFEPKGESWSANNGLGVEIDVLVYRDRDGVLYEANGRVENGAVATLTRAEGSGLPVRAWRTLAETLRQVGYPTLPAMIEGRPIDDEMREIYQERLAQLSLPKGSYLALFDEAHPAADDLGLDTEIVFARHTILGLTDGGEAR